MNGEWMKMYMLTMYIIRMQCDDIMINHHLGLNVAYDFTYATNEILVVHVGCNLFLFVNYSCKLKLFF
jgi:hypothetical protein